MKYGKGKKGKGGKGAGAQDKHAMPKGKGGSVFGVALNGGNRQMQGKKTSKGGMPANEC